MAEKKALVLTGGQIEQLQSGDTLAGASGGVLGDNVLINGGFDLAQRQTPATSTTIVNQAYGPDRWRSYVESVAVQYRRYKRGDSGSSFTNLTSWCYGRWTKITNSTKFLVCQPVEAVQTYPLVGRTVIFQCQLRADSSRTFKLGLVEWAGTEDTLTAAMISAWNGSGSNPTFATNYTLAANASCAVTTSFQTFSVSATVGSSAKNLVPVIFSDSGVTASTGYLEVAEAGLYDGSSTRAWLPADPVREFQRAYRYFYKSYPIDTSPGTAFTLGDQEPFYSTNGSTLTYQGYGVLFPIPMRAIPTFTPYDASGASGKISYYNGGWLNNGTPMIAVRQSGFCMLIDGNIQYGSAICAHFTASCEL